MLIPDIITGEMVDTNAYTGVWYSASLISDYQDCPAKAYGRITKQKILNPGVSLIKGSGIHQGIEVFLKERKDPIKAYNDYLQSECEKQGLVMPESDRLEGEFLVAVAHAYLSNPKILDRVEPDLVERKFRIARNGRLYVGKMDLLIFDDLLERLAYTIVDWKSGKYAPAKYDIKLPGSSYELNTDLQFTMYPWAAYHDMNLPTHGLWASNEVYFHLRGKDITVYPINPKTGKQIKKDVPKRSKYDFTTVRTPEFVEQVFQDTIEPVCQDIEDGRFRRNRSDSCYYCNFFRKDVQKCGVELPGEGTGDTKQISLLGRDPRADKVKVA